MINKRVSSYHSISNLDELEREKQYVKQLIQKQGVSVEKDWDEIYGFWSFVPKTANFVSNFVSNIPINLNVLTFIFDILRKRKRK
ncbi:MAG: hypothetical protein J6X16_05975 [Bacteroidales bacterium]|nr:hypothetical protein [Bacteroidales bacterium]